MRAGKIDVIDAVSPVQAQAMRRTNPEILQIPILGTQALTVQPRNDIKPFSDIRVRKAMQMAIDLPTIAKDYYHGLVEPIPFHGNLKVHERVGIPLRGVAARPEGRVCLQSDCCKTASETMPATPMDLRQCGGRHSVGHESHSNNQVLFC